MSLGAKGDEGLIVPVIRDCDKKTLVEIALGPRRHRQEGTLKQTWGRTT